MVSSLETVASISLMNCFTDNSTDMMDDETDRGEAANAVGFPNAPKQRDHDRKHCQKLTSGP